MSVVNEYFEVRRGELFLFVGQVGKRWDLSGRRRNCGADGVAQEKSHPCFLPQIQERRILQFRLKNTRGGSLSVPMKGSGEWVLSVGFRLADVWVLLGPPEIGTGQEALVV